MLNIVWNYVVDQEHPGCQVYGQTVTTDHHEELVKLGINPSLKGVEPTEKFPYVIFCAPPSRSSDYPGDVRYVVLYFIPILFKTACNCLCIALWSSIDPN